MTDPLAGHLGRHQDRTHQAQALWKQQAYDTVDPNYRLYYVLILTLLMQNPNAFLCLGEAAV